MKIVKKMSDCQGLRELGGGEEGRAGGIPRIFRAVKLFCMLL